MTDIVLDWILDWFEENTTVSRQDAINDRNLNYFEKRWMDSFKFILFISEIEEKFCISFSNEEFQNREFATISGLCSIVQRKINGKKV
jgi:acyl carrier protein